MLTGVSQKKIENEIRELGLQDYMAMGENGMGEMAEMGMQGPENTLPMMAGEGPFGSLEMGGMFTVLKVRDHLNSYDQDPGWYQAPEGTMAHAVGKKIEHATREQSMQGISPGGTRQPADCHGGMSAPAKVGQVMYTCPMHPEIRQTAPGQCPKCGMTLKPVDDDKGAED